ncbi:MAG: OadG family protein [Thiovulaceae bacterium]|nr:OadG family protein [Sulfurimonadaceae bacterium]
MEVDLVIEGLKFMVLGMGTVFVFLTIMIIVINIQAKIVDKFFPDVPVEAEPISMTTKTSKKNKIAAIMGAILFQNQTKR